MNEIILYENREQNSLRYKNFNYLLKRGGKVASCFRCATSKCYATISLSVDKDQ